MNTANEQRTQEIKAWCEKYIPYCKWVINENMEIDVDGNCTITDYPGHELPYKFGVVTGSFCAACDPRAYIKIQLSSLKNCPTTVHGNFDVSGNTELTSLEGGPTYVGGKYKCNHCGLTSLSGIASEIRMGLYAYGNKKLNSIAKFDDVSFGGYADFEFCPLYDTGEKYNELKESGRIVN